VQTKIKIKKQKSNKRKQGIGTSNSMMILLWSVVAQFFIAKCCALSTNRPLTTADHQPLHTGQIHSTRREIIFGMATLPFLTIATASNALDKDDKTPESFDVDSYLRTGYVSSPMGVSGQAGKSRPETGVYVQSRLSANASKSECTTHTSNFLE
jgi:hypothetical protein